jgi:hypothetical protein
MFHPALDRAIRQFLREERLAVTHHMARLARAGPFKEEDAGAATEEGAEAEARSRGK